MSKWSFQMHALHEEILQMGQFQMAGCYMCGTAWEMQYHMALLGGGGWFSEMERNSSSKEITTFLQFIL